MGIQEQMTPEQKITQIHEQLNAQIILLENQKRQLMKKRNQLIAQIILEESDLSKIDDFDFVLYLSPITDEQLSHFFNNADIIKLRYYLESAIILVEHGNHEDRNRLLENIRSAAYSQLNDPDDFVDILTHKIEYKCYEEIVRMMKQIIINARQQQKINKLMR